MRRLALGALVSLLLAVPAHASVKSVSAERPADRDCTARAVSGAPGVTTSSFTAPADGTLRARLLGGGENGDWDLAAFDSAGTLIAGSSAFRANELVVVHLRRGAQVTLQACRIAGRGARVPMRTNFTKVNFNALDRSGPVSLVDVAVTAPWQLETLEALGLDVTHDVRDGRARVILYGDGDRATLRDTGLAFEVVRRDLLAADRRARARDRGWAARVGRSGLPSGRTEYRTYEDVQRELKQMERRFPSLVRGFTLETKTYEGRDIQAVEIARRAGSKDDGRPVLFLNGIHHAREWPATEVLMEFAWDLLKNADEDPQLAAILRKVRVVMQPYTNVDGFIVSRAALGQPEDVDSDAGIVYSTATGVVILGGSFGYKRKNCNPYPVPAMGQPCDVNFGTDNNRNYPHTWGGGGASSNPNDQSYRGEGPGSEPETLAVQRLHLSLNAPVLLSMHNVAAKVLRPPGTEAENFAPDEKGLKELGRRMAEPTGYANQYGWQLYDVTGGTKDWSYAATGAFGYTVETGPAGADFHGDYRTMVVDQYRGAEELAGRGMREALIEAAKWTRNRRFTSRIAGTAPAGRTLRITKEFVTESAPVCTVGSALPVSFGPIDCVAPGPVQATPEKIEFTTKVPTNGRFTWWINPSTRPYAAAPETYHLTCERRGRVLAEKDVMVARGETARLRLACGRR
ncbi:MAG TPA: M14 family zinc carboxypeptidase [Thermoleophilaceae bacterium]|nr:M14 family zinc carboxypeptidase [Thermoleophilaceae bacterium]